MPQKPILILILLLAVYTLLSVYRPSGLMAYAVPSIFWALLVSTTIAVQECSAPAWSDSIEITLKLTAAQ